MVHHLDFTTHIRLAWHALSDGWHALRNDGWHALRNEGRGQQSERSNAAGRGDESQAGRVDVVDLHAQRLAALGVPPLFPSDNFPTPPRTDRTLVTLKTIQPGSAASLSPKSQLTILGDVERVVGSGFRDRLDACGHPELRRTTLQTLQINVGKVCNQTCSHCHVDAGPTRRESMSAATATAVLDFLGRSRVTSLDITGGAPEMNPNFKRLVAESRALGKRVIDRCNLTILLANGFTDLPQFLANHAVEIVASLPCYLEENCDAQRGNGVFKKSIEAIRGLNRLGYGRPDSPLQLNLVYNPVGLGLPPNQAELETEYREQLLERYGIRFNRLFTITNMPVSRFLEDLLRRGKFEAYLQHLAASFNPATIEDLMCRSLLSIDWQGYLFDCDFNQMLDLPTLVDGQRRHISEIDDGEFESLPIATGNHCFGCTAGCGSGCGGSLT